MFVIRSMSTTDYVSGADGRPAQKPVPYHVYLKPPEKRAGAWWTSYESEAMKFETLAEAELEWRRLWPGHVMGTQDIALVNHIVPIWQNTFHVPEEMNPVPNLTAREQDLLSALASTGGVTVHRMVAILGTKYPALALGDAIRKEVSTI